MTWFSIASVAIALFIPAALCVFSLRYPPGWVYESPVFPKWKQLNIISLALSSLLIVATKIMYSAYSDEYALMAMLAIGTMSFIAIQTFATDFTLRLADRRVLRIANLVAASSGLWFLITYTDETMVLLYMLFFLVFSAFFFVPKIGASDVRALQLVTLAGVPVLGLQGFQIGFILVAVAVIAYGVVVSLRTNGNLSGMLTKLSTPLVPLIITPFALMVLIYPLFS